MESKWIDYSAFESSRTERFQNRESQTQITPADLRGWFRLSLFGIPFHHGIKKPDAPYVRTNSKEEEQQLERFLGIATSPEGFTLPDLEKSLGFITDFLMRNTFPDDVLAKQLRLKLDMVKEEKNTRAPIWTESEYSTVYVQYVGTVRGNLTHHGEILRYTLERLKEKTTEESGRPIKN